MGDLGNRNHASIWKEGEAPAVGTFEKGPGGKSTLIGFLAGAFDEAGALPLCNERIPQRAQGSEYPAIGSSHPLTTPATYPECLAAREKPWFLLPGC